MNKLLLKSTSVIAICFLAGCSTKTGMGNTSNKYGSPANYGNTSMSMYKDGTFIGEGNSTPAGKQIAQVSVSGGKIINVILRSLDKYGRDITNSESGYNTSQSNRNAVTPEAIYPGTTSSSGGTITKTSPSTNNPNAATIPGGTVDYTTPGRNTNVTPGGVTSVNPNGTANTTPGAATDNNLNGTTGTDLNRANTATPGGAIRSNKTKGYVNTLAQAKSILKYQILRNQTAYIDIQHNLSGSDVTKLNNYKLAIQRALQNAKK